MVAFADLLNPVGRFSPRPTAVSRPALAAHCAVTASNPFSISTQISIKAVHNHSSPLMSPHPSTPSCSSSPGLVDDSPNVLMHLQMEPHPPHKVRFHLFQDQVPQTCNFFRALCPPDLDRSIVLTLTTDRQIAFDLPPRTASSSAFLSVASTALELAGFSPGVPESPQGDELGVECDRPWMVGLTKTASGGAQVLISLSTPFDPPSAPSPLSPLSPPPPPPTSFPTPEPVYFAQIVDTSSQQALEAFVAAHQGAQQQHHPVRIIGFEITTPPPETFVEPPRLKSQRSESPPMSKMTADSPTSEESSTSETSRASATPSLSGRSSSNVSSNVSTEKRVRPWGSSWMTIDDLKQVSRKRKVLVRRKKVNASPTFSTHSVVNPPVGERRWGPSWTDGAALAEEEEFVFEWVEIDEEVSQHQRPEETRLQASPVSPTVKQEGHTPTPISPVVSPSTVNTPAFKMAAEDEETRAPKRRKWSAGAEPSNDQASAIQFQRPVQVLSNRPTPSSTTGSISPHEVGAAQPRTLAAERVSIRGLLSGGKDGPLPDLAFPRSSATSTSTPCRFTDSSSPSGSEGSSWGSLLDSSNVPPPVRKPSTSAPPVPTSPTVSYPQRSTSDGHLSRQPPSKATGPPRISCARSAAYPQSAPNRLGTARDRSISSTNSTSSGRTSYAQEPVYHQQQYDYPHRNRYEHQFQVSLSPTPHEEMEQMRISTTGDDGGLRIEQYDPNEYGGRRQRRRNTTTGQEAAPASTATHARRPSGSAYSLQGQAQPTSAPLPIPQPLIYLPPSSPEASHSRQRFIRKRKHEDLTTAVAAR